MGCLVLVVLMVFGGWMGGGIGAMIGLLIAVVINLRGEG